MAELYMLKKATMQPSSSTSRAQSADPAPRSRSVDSTTSDNAASSTANNLVSVPTLPTVTLSIPAPIQNTVSTGQSTKSLASLKHIEKLKTELKSDIALVHSAVIGMNKTNELQKELERNKDELTKRILSLFDKLADIETRVKAIEEMLPTE